MLENLYLQARLPDLVMKRLLLPLLAALALPLAVEAKPVYLECKFFKEKTNDIPDEMEITLFENQGKVSIVGSVGGSTQPAVFNPKLVEFGPYTLDRTTGVARRVVIVGGQVLLDEKGKCTKAKEKKTLF